MAASKQEFIAGFDFGGTKMRVAVLSPSNKIVGRAEGKTKNVATPKAGVERIVALVNEAFEAARQQYPDAQLAGLGLAVPGPVNPEKGVIHELPNIGWKNVPIAKFMEKAIGAPVAVINDVDAGIFGEYHFGAARGARTAVGVFPGTGIGGGAVINGALLLGPGISCMEIGHFPVMRDGPLCGCGQRGCLEAVAGRFAIAQEAAVAACRGLAPNLFELVGTDIAQIRSRTLAKAIAAGDEVVGQIVRQAARHIGLAVAAVVNLLAADCVVLGGGLVEAMPEIFVPEVGATAKARAMESFRDRVAILAAKLGDDAAILGAAHYAAQQLT